MSHILKALDRAAADRVQGEAPPAFTAPPVPPPVYDDEDGERRWSPARWTFVAALIILSSAVTWSTMRRGMPEPAGPAAPDPVVAAAQDAAPAAPTPAASAPGATAPAPAGPLPAASTPAASAPTSAAGTPGAAGPPAVAVPIVVGPSAPAPAAAATPSTPAIAPQARAALAPVRKPLRIFPANHVYTRDELPDVARAHLPALNVGMAVYAEVPAKRRVYIGGKPYREGQMVAPGLRLEEIGKREMRLRYGAYRLRVPY